VQLYTDDAVLLAPEAPSAVGIERCGTLTQASFRRSPQYAFEIAEVKLLSPNGRSASNSKGVVKILANGAQVPEAARAVRVAQEPGRWKIARYSFSSVAAAGK